jgi:uncharacterized protein (DUF1697 family)
LRPRPPRGRVRFAVFLRAANVGGRNALSSKALAEDLSDLDVESVGAAGTFLVGDARSEASVRKAFASKLPVACDVIVRPLDEIADLVRRDPFSGEDPAFGRHVTILAEKPAKRVAFPIDAPPTGAFECRVLRLDGFFALSLRREGSKHYPNAVVEKALGVRATTRGWSTLTAVAKKARTAR